MSPEQQLERIETALQELTRQGTRISITAVAAAAGIPRSSLYRNAQARELINQRITDERLNPGRNLAAEVTRLGTLVDALAAHVRDQEERLRQLEGRPHTTPR